MSEDRNAFSDKVIARLREAPTEPARGLILAEELENLVEIFRSRPFTVDSTQADRPLVDALRQAGLLSRTIVKSLRILAAQAEQGKAPHE